MALSSVAALPTAAPSIPSSKVSNVKQERPDDEEINALAARMVEANKAKMASTTGRTGVPSTPGQPGQPRQTQMAGANQPAILNFLTRNGQSGPPGSRGEQPVQNAQSGAVSVQNSSEKPPCDADSVKMHFGWVTLGKNHIPYIVRYGSEKYCAVRMVSMCCEVEMKLLSKYLNYLHSDIYNCTCIRSYYITEAEARLLNDINVKHCDIQFGRDPFTTKDLVVRLQDADEFYTFLDVCYNKLVPNSNCHSNKCGFIRIDGESVVPYILRNGTKYVPVFYFEGEIASLFQKSETLEGWDLAYLKFCCKVQGIRAELFEKDNCSVISLEDIKGYFPTDTNFEDYWPTKVVDRQLLVAQNKSDSSGAQWTLPSVSVSANACAVPTPSPSSVNKVPSMASAVPRQTPHTTAYNMNQAMTNGWTGLVGGQAAYPTTQSNRMAQAIMHNVATTHYQSTPAQVRSSVHSGLTSAVPGSAHPYYQQQSSMQMAMVSGASAVQPPPPLVRVTGSQSTAGRSSSMYSNANALSHMMNLPVGQHSTQMLPPPQPQAQAAQPQSHAHYPSNNKFPPPLVSVNGATPSYHYMSNGTDVIDLSSPPQSPQMGQRQHHVSNGKTMPTDSRCKLIQIPDCSTSGSHMPYKVQKALVEGRMVPCINAKPYVYTELLMTLPDLTAHFFPSIPVSNCKQGLQDVLRLDLYRGNRQQMLILKEAGKCSSSNDILPLVQVKDVMQFMPQMKYMFASRRSAEEPPSKMKRTS